MNWHFPTLSLVMRVSSYSLGFGLFATALLLLAMLYIPAVMDFFMGGGVMLAALAAELGNYDLGSNLIWVTFIGTAVVAYVVSTVCFELVW